MRSERQSDGPNEKFEGTLARHLGKHYTQENERLRAENETLRAKLHSLRRLLDDIDAPTPGDNDMSPGSH